MIICWTLKRTVWRFTVRILETDGLIGTAVAPAVLAYLFPRMGRFNGRPTLLIIDEGWLALDDADFAGRLREWSKLRGNAVGSSPFRDRRPQS
jgi:hypothetical protein